jgi:hypothetical protein
MEQGISFSFWWQGDGFTGIDAELSLRFQVRVNFLRIVSDLIRELWQATATRRLSAWLTLTSSVSLNRGPRSIINTFQENRNVGKSLVPEGWCERSWDLCDLPSPKSAR